MRKLILFLLLFVSAKVNAQVYQEMPQYGYRANRMAFDSTLQIPTVCGVPTLKSIVKTNKSGAIAYDSCNAKFYAYNPKTQIWSEVSGGGGGGDFWKINGTTTLTGAVNISSNSTITFAGIDEDLPLFNVNALNIQFDGGNYKFASLTSITDTTNYKPLGIASNGQIAPLTSWVGGGSTIDTTNKFVNSVASLNDSTFRVIKGTSTTDITIKSVTNAVNAKTLTTQVYNKSGAVITKGSVVYIDGAHSSVLPSIALAIANTEQLSAYTYGLVLNDIGNNSEGTVIQVGSISGLNLPTSTYTDGQTLYLSPIVPGGYTTTKPLAPNHYVSIGTVIRAHPTLGNIQVTIRNGFQLDEMSDVSIPLVPADSVLLQFSRVDSLWHDVSVTNAIGNKYLKPSDTSVFQRKSLSANTIMANNTSGTANATAQIFKQFGNQTYTDSITITGASNPSGAINHTFRWSQIGNLITLHITLTYATTGSLSQVAIEIPDGLPAPILPTGLNANNDIICYGSGYMVTNTTAVAGVFSKVFLRQNTGLTNDYEVVINQAANNSYRIMNATIQYFAQ